MANQELRVLNSVSKNNSVQILFGDSIDELFIRYGEVWQWMKQYYMKYRAVPDMDAIQDNFEDVENIETKSQPAYYVDTLRTEFLKSKMDTIITNRALELDDGEEPSIVIDRLQKSLNRLSKFRGGSKDIDIMDFEDAERFYNSLREKSEAMGGVPGISTMIPFIDSACPRGFQGGDIISIIGYPARGKSAMVSLLSANAYSRGFKPMVASLEMTADAVRDRVYTVLGSGLFRNSDLMVGNYDVDNFRTFASRNSNKSKFIVVENEFGSVMTPNTLQSKIDQYRPDILFIDYLQLFHDNGHSENMTTRMMNLSLELKQLAMVNNIPIVVITSATPDGTTNITEPPNVEKSAWSRQIAYDSTVCIAVHKHDDTNIFQIECAKNRYGPLFAGYLEWDIDNGIIKEKFDL